MNVLLDIPTTTVETSRIKQFDFQNIDFGKHATDHMVIADYYNESWNDFRIEPFANILISPLCSALHYGQSVFEGMKAFRRNDGHITIFRPDKHHQRFNVSLNRMCMPAVSYNMFLSALHRLVQLDSAWVSDTPESALYLRPFCFANEEKLGVKISKTYMFSVVASPMNRYYPKPLRVKVEREYIRAAQGGVGFAKCAGNYGAAFYPTRLAQQQGFDQVIWTDAANRLYVEESGTMNLMFVFGETLVTPPLAGTILDGVTRDSLLNLARRRGLETQERQVGVDELQRRFEQGEYIEAFGAGTAASIAPIGEIHIDGVNYAPALDDNALMFSLKNELNSIRQGLVDDSFGWNYIVEQ